MSLSHLILCVLVLHVGDMTVHKFSLIYCCIRISAVYLCMCVCIVHHIMPVIFFLVSKFVIFSFTLALPL